MKKVVFMVEKTNTGFSAYAEDFEKYSVGTTGATIEELKRNILDALNTLSEHKGEKEFSEDDISTKLDLPNLFEFYQELNATAIGKRAGINKTLLSQYVNGHKSPSPKQLHKIVDSIKQLAKELESLELIEA